MERLSGPPLWRGRRRRRNSLERDTGHGCSLSTLQSSRITITAHRDCSTGTLQHLLAARRMNDGGGGMLYSPALGL
ncbi:hypothetical protein CDEST_03115 [Colletotrichum destructivum]|uniref:Uncharacterized protein n=1 Tax=Colletotrichum destructivum TaxID=34406 RepID=A0AAX4I506_9PEZI|nr:hypothetical protein CDEST_03115 [Colletotrichum destructivum]